MVDIGVRHTAAAHLGDSRVPLAKEINSLRENRGVIQAQARMGAGQSHVQGTVRQRARHGRFRRESDRLKALIFLFFNTSVKLMIISITLSNLFG